MTRAPQAQMTSRAPNECWNRYQTVFISLVIALVIPLTSCKNSQNQEQSSIASVQGLACAGQWLGSFIQAIPLPGFAVLGEVFGGVGKAAVQGAAGALKSTSAGQAKGLCGTAASFSEAQMKQMKQAIAQGFDEQNHKDAVALMNNIDTKLTEFVPDQDRFTQYTMGKLDDIVNSVNTWWSKYDQSGTRIYNVQDFIIVTGYALKAYQHQVREVALEAAATKSAGDAEKVRQYAGVLSDKADHARKELDEISNKDIVAIAKSFWKDDGSKVEKSYDAGALTQNFCTLSKQGKPFLAAGKENASSRLPRFLDGMRQTKNLADLSDYVQKNGSFCCEGGRTCNQDENKVEPAMQTAIAEVTKQVKQVMFTNNDATMKYFNETLPSIIAAGSGISKADDATVFSLAGAATDSSHTDDNSPSPAPATDPDPGSNSGGTCPDGDNGAGKGFGDIYKCGDKQCAKTDKSYATECTVGG